MFSCSTKNLRNLGLYRAFSTSARSFTASTDTLFFITHGLNFTKINFLEAVTVLSLFALEIPTGYIADNYSRKSSLIFSCLVKILAYTLIFYNEMYYSIYVLAYFLLGAGQAFQSGALNAWIADEIPVSKNQKDLMQQQFIVNSNFGIIGNICGAILGAYAAGHYSNSIIWFLAASTSIISLLTLLLIPLNVKKNNQTIKKWHDRIKETYQNIIKNSLISLRTMLSNPLIIKISLFSFSCQFALTGIMKVWQPYFLNLLANKNEIVLGYIWSSFVLMNFIANIIINKIRKKNDINKLIIFGFMSGMPLILFGFHITFILALLLYLIHVIAETAKDPIINTILHHNIPSQQRATIESWYSIGINIFEFIGFIIMGILSDKYDIRFIFLFSGVIFVLSTLFLILNKKLLS